VVSSQKGLQVIMSHFQQYPLITQKKADFVIFKRILEIVSSKGHLDNENEEGGLQEIVNLRAALNLGSLRRRILLKLLFLTQFLLLDLR